MKYIVKIGIFLLFTIALIRVNAQTGEPSGRQKEEDQQTGLTQDKDSLETHIKKWKIGEDITESQYQRIDTTLRKNDVFRSIFKRSLFSYYLGNIGLAGYPMYFPDRPSNTRYIFARSYEPYFEDADETYYYNTNKPYTVLDYTMSSRSRDKQTIDILHTQNIIPSFNTAVKLGGHRSAGAYTSQQTSAKYIGTSMNWMRKHYSVYASFFHNVLENDESGGLDIDRSNEDGPIISAKLDEASSKYSRQSAFLGQTLKLIDLSGKSDTSIVGQIKPLIEISHNLSYKRDAYKFTEQTINVNEPLYNNIYFDSTSTNDSTHYARLKNELQFKIHEHWNKKFPVGIQFNLTNSIKKYYNFKSFLLQNSTEKFSDWKIEAQMFNNASKKWQWNGGFEYYLSGYRKNNFEVYGSLQKKFSPENFPVILSGSAKYRIKKPSYFDNQFYSNHVKWDKNLNNKYESLIKGSIEMPEFDLSAEIQASRHENYVYYDSTVTPQQVTPPMNVISTHLRKTFHLGKFRLSNRVFYQFSDLNQYIHLPKIGYFGSLYFQDWVFDVLHTQIGINFKYISKHYMPGYDPVTAQFYSQSREKTGGEPLGSAFANFRWKRALLFVKFSHLNSLLYGANEYYFPVKDYPQPKLTFTFGVSWKFYD